MKAIATIACIVGLLAGAATPVIAQGSAPPAAASPHALELARRYVEVTRMERNMHLIVDQMLPAMLKQMLAQRSTLPQGEQDRIRVAVTEATTEASGPFFRKYLERVVPAIAATYTEAELEHAIKYYESPLAQSMLDKAPVVTQQVQSVVIGLMPEFQQDIRERMCAKIDCGAR